MVDDTLIKLQRSNPGWSLKVRCVLKHRFKDNTKGRLPISKSEFANYHYVLDFLYYKRQYS